jgi:hypothetical protein
VLTDIDDLAGAKQSFLRSLALVQQIHAATIECEALITLANSEATENDVDGQIAHARQGLAIAQRIGKMDQTLAATDAIAAGQLWEGDLPAARAGYLQALAMARKIGDPLSVTTMLMDLAELETAAATSPLHASTSPNPTRALCMGASINTTWQQIDESALNLAEGHPELVNGPMTTVGAKHTTVDPASQAWRLVAESWLVRGDLTKAHNAIDKVLVLARAPPDTRDFLLADSLLAARIDAGEGHGAKALSELSPLLARAQRMKDMELQLRIRLAQGQIEKQIGNLSRSRAILPSVQSEAGQYGFDLIAQQASRAE